MKRVLTIAGSDSGGGAGIQIDIKTATTIGCDSSTVITALTAQNLREVRLVEPVSATMVEAQIRAVFDDIRIDAVKIGMLGSAATAAIVGRLLEQYSPQIVIADPVLIATSGGKLGSLGTAEAIVKHIVPRCTLLTPNINEATALTGIAIESDDDGAKVWEWLRRRGLRAMLLKGGHAQRWQKSNIIDALYTEQDAQRYCSERLESRNTHGTGCTLSTAIASYMARGEELADAVGLGIDFVQSKLQAN